MWSAVWATTSASQTCSPSFRPASRGSHDVTQQILCESLEGKHLKAFIVDRYGGADRLRAGDMPDPELGKDDVLVEIHAAGVNPLDSKIRTGEFKSILPYRLPLILGNELAGVVTRTGSRVRRFNPGDEVYARPDKDRIGTFAELISMNEDAVAIKPKGLTTKSPHPRGLRRSRNICNPAGEACWGGRSDHNEYGESRLGKSPRRGYRHRLQQGRFRNNPAGLRCRFE